MKKIIVCGALFHLSLAQVYAAQTPAILSETISTNSKSHQGIQKVETTHQKKNTTTKKRQLVGINCDYRISGDTQKIDKALVVSWAEYAVLHSFDFNFQSFDTQLKNLRACYTKNGWASFVNALHDSKNINSIKTKNLMVSSTLDGEVQFIDTQENQWQMNVPIKVLYKNDKEEVTHFLNVYIIISWRNPFKLGIAQIVATPRATPLSQKAITIREAMKGFSLSVTQQMDNVENLQKKVASFLTSLLTSAPIKSFSELDKALNLPELCLKSVRDDAQKAQPLVEVQKHQVQNHKKSMAAQPVNLASIDKKTEEIIAIENPSKANGFEWAQNQFLAIKSDFVDTKLPQLLTYFKEQGAVGSKLALEHLDKIKTLKTQNLDSQQRDKKRQLAENKTNQWHISFPMQLVHQNDTNQITQLNVNLTLGRKNSGELVILKTNAMPTVNSSSSNHAEALVSNAHLPASYQRAGSMQQTNKIQPVQDLEHLQATQVPKIIFNTTSELLKTPEAINCDFKVPDGMTKIDEELVKKWAENATIQSFDFNSDSIDTQLQKLKSCYTAKGWEHFKNALDKSGNIEAIKSQKLIMSSKVSGQTKLIATRNNQWNMELLLQVVYQNKQIKVIKFLNVDLSMERKPSGDFGIARIIATLNDPANANTAVTNLSNKDIDSVQKTQQVQAEQQKKADFIDCDYKVSAETNEINQNIILDWAQYAVIKSFNFDSEAIDLQLKKLQACYTDQAWYEFISSLEKSGNMKTFKTKKLRATSQIDGKIQIVESSDNTWALTLPLKINYQYENGNVIQLLKIDLTIGRKNTGGFGIIQLNSSLRVASIPRSMELLANPKYAFG
ncbi:DotI/IcmL family type IV secretion protein [Legionella sp. PATHC038]|uniref:DotI/IcmL family type IV secretion protein n=1 Tax=Legionella sheltonii TaxID=2992041 RepID=UPI002243EFC5|nr:DotI/IcmL family type IV secretion protein [Legionella sp. PATHC038]MCW8397736.1 DotI/IcmL family type IV secretion protein [Legionella sp. PATHC038]